MRTLLLQIFFVRTYPAVPYFFFTRIYCKGVLARTTLPKDLVYSELAQNTGLGTI